MTSKPWVEETMREALSYIVNGGSTKGASRKFQISSSTMFRRSILVQNGVPLELASRRDLTFPDYSQYLSKDIKSLPDLEKKMRELKTNSPNSSIVETNLENTHNEPVTDPVDKFCSVPHCSSDSRKDPNLSFFNLPKENKRAIQWAKKCGRPEWADPAKIHFSKKYTLLCARHFSDEMFVNKEKTKLEEHAFPIFPIVKSTTPTVIPIAQNGFSSADKDPLELDADPLAIESPLVEASDSLNNSITNQMEVENNDNKPLNTSLDKESPSKADKTSDSRKSSKNESEPVEAEGENKKQVMELLNLRSVAKSPENNDSQMRLLKSEHLLNNISKEIAQRFKTKNGHKSKSKAKSKAKVATSSALRSKSLRKPMGDLLTNGC